MKKKLLMSSIILGISLLGMLTLNAASDRIKIVSPNYDSKQLSEDGMHITNIINTSKTDLVNGEVAIEIIIDNSKHTEIMYAIDNGNAISAIKGNLIDNIKTNALSLEDLGNIKQGIVTNTNEGINSVPLDNKNIEMQLENIKGLEKSADGEIFNLIEEGIKSFSDKADVKFMVVALSSMPNLSTEQVTNLKNQIAKYEEQGIKFIVYGINITNDNLNNIFASSTKYEIQTNNLSEIKYAGNVIAELPKEKPAIASTISFDKYILDNFNIKDVKTDLGMASYDANNNLVIWEAGNIKTNQVVRLTYYLSLKEAVDQSVVDKINLRTNRQIKVTQTGQLIGMYPADDKIEDQICSPTIRILKEAVDNPKTGIASYIIFGACMLAVASITILVLRKKNKFGRI